MSIRKGVNEADRQGISVGRTPEKSGGRGGQQTAHSQSPELAIGREQTSREARDPVIRQIQTVNVSVAEHGRRLQPVYPGARAGGRRGRKTSGGRAPLQPDPDGQTDSYTMILRPTIDHLEHR